MHGNEYYLYIDVIVLEGLVMSIIRILQNQCLGITFNECIG